jgi:hypothetical protein
MPCHVPVCLEYSGRLSPMEVATSSCNQNCYTTNGAHYSQTNGRMKGIYPTSFFFLSEFVFRAHVTTDKEAVTPIDVLCMTGGSTFARWGGVYVWGYPYEFVTL